jgi:2-oxo-4-hydroxy-4-carboxy--5-ureidoimidazoline (OHCU) decarboxylase
MTSCSPMTWTLARARQADLRREADEARLARVARTATRPADNTARRQLLGSSPGLAQWAAKVG